MPASEDDSVIQIPEADNTSERIKVQIPDEEGESGILSPREEPEQLPKEVMHTTTPLAADCPSTSKTPRQYCTPKGPPAPCVLSDDC